MKHKSKKRQASYGRKAEQERSLDIKLPEDLPTPFLERMKSDIPDFNAFLDSYSEPPVRSLLLNTLRKVDIQYIPFDSIGERVSWEPSGFYFTEDEMNRPGKHILHEAGAYYIQEASAMAPARALLEDHAPALLEDHATALPEDHAKALPEDHVRVMLEEHATALLDDHDKARPEDHSETLPEDHAGVMSEDLPRTLHEDHAGAMSEDLPRTLHEDHTSDMSDDLPRTLPEDHAGTMSEDQVCGGRDLRILDLCAAPGGKTVQLAMMMGGHGLLVSNEINGERARILSQNVERMGIRNAVVTNMAPERLAESFPAFFDRILVDAPCSGEGMFRKTPAAVTEWSDENVSMCAERQRGILACAVDMLRPGGVIVYSTCTFSHEEDEDQVRQFLTDHPDFALIREQKLLPHEVCGEGQYLAVLRQKDEPVGRLSFAASGSDQENQDRLEGNSAVGRGKRSESNQGNPDRLVCDMVAGYGRNCGTDQRIADWSEDDTTVGYGRSSGSDQGNPDLPESDTATGGGRSSVSEHGITDLPKGDTVVGCGRSKSRRKNWNNDRAAIVGGKGRRGEPGVIYEWLGKILTCRDKICPDPSRITIRGDLAYIEPDGYVHSDSLRALRPGLCIARLKEDRNGLRIIPEHALSHAVDPSDAAFVIRLSETEAGAYLSGQTLRIDDLTCAAVSKARENGTDYVLMSYNGLGLGWARLVDGTLKNLYPKGLRTNNFING